MTTFDWNVICWGLVIAVWVIGALYNVFFAPKTVERGSNTLPVLAGVVIAYLAVQIDRRLPANFWVPITFQTPWLWDIGVILLVLSTAFTLWARWVLGQLWAGTTMVKEGHQLRTEGPYRITRNPIYTGLLGMIIGSTLMNGIGILLFAVLFMFIGFEIKIHSEEALLTKTFGEQYLEYKRRVPQLIPGLALQRSK